MAPPNNYNSNIKDHCSQIIITNIIIIINKKFEIFLELLKYNTETEMSKCFWKMAWVDFLNAGLPQTFNLYKKNAVSAKHNKPKHNKMRYACTKLF